MVSRSTISSPSPRRTSPRCLSRLRWLWLRLWLRLPCGVRLLACEHGREHEQTQLFRVEVDAQWLVARHDWPHSHAQSVRHEPQGPAPFASHDHRPDLHCLVIGGIAATDGATQPMVAREPRVRWLRRTASHGRGIFPALGICRWGQTTSSATGNRACKSCSHSSASVFGSF